MTTGSIDYGTHKIATHSFTEDSVTKDVERIAPAAGVMATCAWGTDSTAVSTTGLSTISVNCAGSGRIVVATRGLASVISYLNTATFRIAFYAADNSLIGYSARIFPEFTEIS